TTHNCRSVAVASSNGEDFPVAFDALQRMRPAGFGDYVRSGDEVPHRAGHEHITASAESGHSLRHHHCDTGDVVASTFDLARVETCTNLQADRLDCVADGARALNGAAWAVKGRQRAVSSRLHRDTTEAFELTRHDAVVLVEQKPPVVVTGHA